MTAVPRYLAVFSLVCFIGITVVVPASAIPAASSPVIPISAETLARGGTGIGIHNDVSDWLNNPALTPTSDLAGSVPWPSGQNGSSTGSNLWGVQGSGLFSSNDAAGDTVHNWGLNLATRPLDCNWGLGLGYDHFRSTYISGTMYGIGGGWRPSSLDGFSFGASVKHWTADNGNGYGSDSLTTWDLGLTYSPPSLRNSKGDPLFLGGLVVRDVFDKSSDWGWGRKVDLGASIQLAPNVRAATDEVGLGSHDRAWYKGIEYLRDAWTLRAGDWGGQGTYGIGYAPPAQPWHLDFAHTQKDGEKINMLTATYTFNSNKVTGP